MSFIKKPFLNLRPRYRFEEHHYFDQALHSVSLFPQGNFLARGKFFRLVLNFNFRDIFFSKKKVLPFFLSLELLTNQKCVATLSSKNILIWKLRKGMLSGCKISLRSKNLYDFFDTLSLAYPRMEKVKYILKNPLSKKSNFFSFNLSELIFFYTIEFTLGVNLDIKKLEINVIYDTFSVEEQMYLLRSNKIPVLLKSI